MILVIGKNGQLANELKNFLPKTSEFLSSKDINLNEIQSIKKKLSLFNSKLIINCAAFNNVDAAEFNEQNLNINGIAPGEIASYCNEKNISLIHISTDAVFNGEEKEYSETSKPNPCNAYGMAKFEGESNIKKYHKRYVIIRTSWLYSRQKNSFLGKIIDRFQSQDELYGADDVVSSPTSARSLAEGITKIISFRNIPFGTYHFANKGAASKFDFIKEIGLNMNFDKVQIKKVKNSFFKLDAKRPKNTVLNCRKFEETFDFKMIDWKEELREHFK